MRSILCSISWSCDPDDDEIKEQGRHLSYSSKDLFDYASTLVRWTHGMCSSTSVKAITAVARTSDFDRGKPE